jgi:hypothetical protein
MVLVALVVRVLLDKEVLVLVGVVLLMVLVVQVLEPYQVLVLNQASLEDQEEALPFFV